MIIYMFFIKKYKYRKVLIGNKYMCVAAACKLPIGPNNEEVWVLSKNRDRNYIPEIKFSKKDNNGVEYRIFVDNNTLWAEGVNSHGIGIVNSALMGVDDEKAIKKKNKGESPISHDGSVIKNALKSNDIKEVVEKIYKNDVMGFSLITNGKELYIIENVRRYIQKSKRNLNQQPQIIEQKLNWYKIDDPNIKYVVRTNHGEVFTETGYLKNTMPGKSSRLRRLSVEKAIEKNNPQTLEDFLNCMSVKPFKKSEFNPIREKDKGCELFTTGQIIINPSTRSLYYHPINCKLIEKNKIVTPDEIEDRHDKTHLYVIDKIDDLKNIDNIKENNLYKEILEIKHFFSELRC
jgi:hypothetical protein